MHAYALLAFLPALALAIPQDGGSSSAPTDSLACLAAAADVGGVASCLAGVGFAAPAASYLASAFDDEAIAMNFAQVYTNFPVLESAAIAAAAGQVSGATTNFAGVATAIGDIFDQPLSGVPSGSARDVVASVVSNVQALETGGTSGGSPSSPPGLSPSSSQGVAPARQTGLVIAAGIMAGVVGMAVGL